MSDTRLFELPDEIHYHVRANKDLFTRHKELQSRVGALGVSYPGQVTEATLDLDLAAGIVQNDQDLTQKEVNEYLTNMRKALATVMNLALKSELVPLLRALKEDTMRYIMGSPQNTTEDAPEESAHLAALRLLNLVFQHPYPSEENLRTLVLFQLTKYLEGIPPEFWP